MSEVVGSSSWSSSTTATATSSTWSSGWTAPKRHSPTPSPWGTDVRHPSPRRASPALGRRTPAGSGYGRATRGRPAPVGARGARRCLRSGSRRGSFVPPLGDEQLGADAVVGAQVRRAVEEQAPAARVVPEAGLVVDVGGAGAASVRRWSWVSSVKLEARPRRGRMVASRCRRSGSPCRTGSYPSAGRPSIWASLAAATSDSTSSTRKACLPLALRRGVTVAVAHAHAFRCPHCSSELSLRAVVLPPATFRALRGVARAARAPPARPGASA